MHISQDASLRAAFGTYIFADALHTMNSVKMGNDNMLKGTLDFLQHGAVPGFVSTAHIEKTHTRLWIMTENMDLKLIFRSFPCFFELQKQKEGRL